MDDVGAFSIFAASVVAALAVSAAQQPTFQSTGEAVRVFVTVTDSAGRLVTDLPRDAFEVRDDGKPEPITVFDSTPQPIRLIVMVDVSGSMQGNLPLLRTAAHQLLARLRPDDTVRLGSFGNDITISPVFTRDFQELENGLPLSIPESAPTPLWRAMAQAIAAFGDGLESAWGDDRRPGAGEDDRRSVVLVLSDGKDAPAPGFRQPFVSQVEVIERARDRNVMVYAVGMRSRGARPAQPGIGPGGLRQMMLADLPDPGLARVAEETGGGYIEIRYGQDLAAAFEKVAEELHGQYLIGYAPPKRDGKVHRVEVRLARRGLSARARKSYVAPKA